MKLFFLALLVITNLMALFFLGLVFLGSPAVDPEALRPVSERQIIVSHLLWGVAVTLFFSLLAVLIAAAFQRWLSLDRKYLKRLFFLQFIFLLIAFALMFGYMYVM
jgi:hypothetical protein